MSNKETLEAAELSDAANAYSVDSLDRLEQLESVVHSSESVAHDINNQLAAIIALSDLLMRSAELESKSAGKVEQILDSARAVSELVEKWQRIARGTASLPKTHPTDPLDQLEVQPSGERQRSMSELKQILLVDDEEVVCAATEEMLKRIGYDVTSVQNGRAAIRFFTDNWQRIDLVVLDMMMPEMDGAEVLERIKAIHPEVRVIVSSGYSENDNAQSLIAKGANGYIQKPFRLRELSQTIERVWQSS